EKEKAKDFKGALEKYSQIVVRNPADQSSLRAMHRLAVQEKDTTQLMESLVRLNREKVVDTQFKYELAELDFKRSGNLAGVEKLVKLHPDYKRGKTILVQEYIRQNAKIKLVPYEGFLVSESKTNKALLE